MSGWLVFVFFEFAAVVPELVDDTVANEDTLAEEPADVIDPGGVDATREFGDGLEAEGEGEGGVTMDC